MNEYSGPPPMTDGAANLVLEISGRAIDQAAKRPTQLMGIAEDVVAARKILFDALEGLGKTMDGFLPAEKECLERVRLFRMSVVSELSGATKALADVRKFFLDESHDAEVKRLREFVDLCERLNKLKESGFLDSVADTILKLES